MAIVRKSRQPRLWVTPTRNGGASASRFWLRWALSSLRWALSSLRWGLSSLRWALLACGGVTLSACGVATFIVQQYDGEPVSVERIAILRVNGNDPVRLEEVDGEVLSYELHDPGSRVHIEMLPGQHEIGLSDGLGLPLKRRRFVAEAGKVYRPMVFHLGSESGANSPAGSWVVAIYEVDRESDMVLREISQVPLPPPVTPSVTTPMAAPRGEPLPDRPAPPSAVSPTPGDTGATPPSPDPGHANTPNATALPKTPSAAALPNTTSPALPGPSQPVLSPSPIPPGVSPAKGPAPNPMPPSAETLQ